MKALVKYNEKAGSFEVREVDIPKPILFLIFFLHVSDYIQ